MKKPNATARAERGPQQRGLRTRAAILEGALRLIARSGLGAIRFRAVAEEAGVSLGVATYHFPTRRDLLTAAFELHLSQVDQQGRAFTDIYTPAWHANELSLDEIADAVLQLLESFVVKDRDSFIASQELGLELMRDPDLASRVQGAVSTHDRIVLELVERAGSTEPEVDAELLAATLQGLGLKWLTQRGDPNYREQLRPVVRRLMEHFLTTA